MTFQGAQTAVYPLVSSLTIPGVAVLASVPTLPLTDFVGFSKLADFSELISSLVKGT